MLIVEKYFLENKINCAAPICNKEGLIIYAKDFESKGWSYHFLHYVWEGAKNHPGFYNIKTYDVVDRLDDSLSYLAKDTQYRSWTEFFKIMFDIKSKILSSNVYDVAKDQVHARCLVWRAFLKTQDCSFASFFKTLPDSFFASVDDTLSYKQQDEARELFLKFLKNNYYVIYNSWVYFLEPNIDNKFCNWFYSYIYETDRI